MEVRVMTGIIKKYMELRKELEKLEKSIEFVYICKADGTEHSQMIEKQQRDFLWGLGFSLVDDNELLANHFVFKFAAPESMEPSVVHNIRCKLNLIQQNIIRGDFESLDIYNKEFAIA
jgi:hypothetical protein